MPTVYKQLAGAAGNGTIGTGSNLYTASASANTSTIISSVVVCNAGTTARTYSIVISSASATLTTGRFVVFQATIGPNDTHTLTLGLVLDPTNRFLNVSSSSTEVNFSAYGAEIT